MTLTREQWAAFKRRMAETDRLLLERIAYHRAKLIEERPGWTPPATEQEWVAYHEARIAARLAAHDP
jgi:hypothetical protein